MDTVLLPAVLGISCCWSNSTSFLPRSDPEISRQKLKLKLARGFADARLNSRISVRATGSWSCICIYRCRTRDNGDRLWSTAALNREYLRVYAAQKCEAVWKHQQHIFIFFLVALKPKNDIQCNARFLKITFYLEIEVKRARESLEMVRAIKIWWHFQQSRLTRDFYEKHIQTYIEYKPCLVKYCYGTGPSPRAQLNAQISIN